ncbi:MAG: hypothetical protein IKE52_05825 [Mogibacterium sp.]|nr:hypothetical protein [Mogibacterium sp.]
MNNQNNKNISTHNEISSSFKTLMLTAAFLIVLVVLAGCNAEPETYPEAEAKVGEELELIKKAEPADEAFEALKIAAGELDGSILEGYLDKVKDFDYEIVGSQKAEAGTDSSNGSDSDSDGDSNGGSENTCVVRVRITTYDFANEYLKAWNEYMTVEEGDRWQSQFYTNLLLRLASVSNKDYVSDVDIICRDDNGDGRWTSDFKTNEELMNALSGGMLNEIKILMSDDVVMDESEVND